MTQQKEVMVFGSGVSGLVAAYYLNKKGFRVSVVDPYKEPILQTLKVKEGIVELAANAILFNEKVKSLLEDLNLDYVFYNSVGRRKYFFRKGEFTRWPLSFFQSLSLLPLLINLIFFKSKLKPKKKETLKAWSLRTLPPEFYKRVFKTALQGVYGPDIDNLSANLVLKSFLKPCKSSKPLKSFELCKFFKSCKFFESCKSSKPRKFFESLQVF